MYLKVSTFRLDSSDISSPLGIRLAHYSQNNDLHHPSV